VWGRACPLKRVTAIERDTPTCVGKRQHPVFQVSEKWGHPHVCGEESLLNIMALTAVGTPPRVWGRDKRVDEHFVGCGDTPTCVGKRKISGRGQAIIRGHPHVCGEECPKSRNP